MNANVFILVDETLYNNIVLKTRNKLNRNFVKDFTEKEKISVSSLKCELRVCGSNFP